MNEYFTKNDNGELVLISSGIEYKVTFATIGDLTYFYQYPTDNEIKRGETTPKRRLVSEINNSLIE